MTGHTATPGHTALSRLRPSRRAVALGQAAFYLPTALWPLVNRRTFEAVTGPKSEWWLVQNVGLLGSVVGLSVGVAGARGRVPNEVVLAGAGSAAAFTAIDIVYLRRGRLRWTYGIDAVAEIVILIAWMLAERARPSSTAAGSPRKKT